MQMLSELWKTQGYCRHIYILIQLTKHIFTLTDCSLWETNKPCKLSSTSAARRVKGPPVFVCVCVWRDQRETMCWGEWRWFMCYRLTSTAIVCVFVCACMRLCVLVVLIRGGELTGALLPNAGWFHARATVAFLQQSEQGYSWKNPRPFLIQFRSTLTCNIRTNKIHNLTIYRAQHTQTHTFFYMTVIFFVFVFELPAG